MKKKLSFVLLFAVLVFAVGVQAQSTADSTGTPKKYQAKAPPTQPFGKEAFTPSNKTTIRWLGMAGFLVNSRGTTFMIDPLLEGYDMPLLMNFPINQKMFHTSMPYLPLIATMTTTVLQPLKI